MKFFDIKKNKKTAVLKMRCEIIDDECMTQIVNYSKACSNLGLDMTNVKTIESKDFIRFLLDDKYKLFNLRHEVLIYLLLVIKHGFLKSFLNEKDFKLKKREFIKRKFLIA